MKKQVTLSQSAGAFVFRIFNIHHKDWPTNSGETDRPGELCYTFPFSDGFIHKVKFPIDLRFRSFFLLLTWLSLLLLSWFLLTFLQTPKEMPLFIAQVMAIFVLIGRVFVIIGYIFHKTISLNSVILLLLNFINGCRLELMFIPLFLNVVKPHSAWCFSTFCTAAIS